MNITLLVNRDVASCLAVNYLMRGLPDHRLTVFVSSRVGSKPLAEPLQYLKFVEQDLFNQLLFPLLADHPVAGGLLGFDQLQDHLPGGVQELNDINTPAGLEKFAASAPELALSVRYGLILRSPVLAIPPLGVLNLHSGRLPDYKGVMATFWALLNNDAQIGTTLHYISDASIDTGPIVATTSLDVDPSRSYLWHVLTLYRDGCQQLIAAVDGLEKQGALAAREQEKGGSYYSFPGEKELAAFSRQGWRLFDPADVTDLAKAFMGR